MSSTSYATPFAVYYDGIDVVNLPKPKANSCRLGFAAYLENPKTGDRGHRHKSVAA